MGVSVILIVFLVCVFASVPIGFAIGLSCVAYVLTAGTINMGYIASGLFASCDSFPLMAIPFFILSGALGLVCVYVLVLQTNFKASGNVL